MNDIKTNDIKTNEAIIERTKTSFVECGLALARIRDGKQYREENYKTFEAYCLERWGWKRAHAYRMIEASQISHLSPIGDKIKTEGQARALAKVPVEKREEVVERAAASGPVTAESIRKASEPEKIIDLDEEGWPIPPEVLDDWRRAEEFASTLRKVSEVKCAVESGLAGDIIFAEVTNTTLADLKNIYTCLKNVVPYAVCPTCQGRTKSKCTLCRRRGFISKFAWDHFVPAEVKAIREKAKVKK